MEALTPPPALLLPRRFLFPLLLLLLFPLDVAAVMASSPPSARPGPRCMDSERIALLQFKAGLQDPEGRVSSWRGYDCCQWTGVVCNNRTGAVVKLDLRNPFQLLEFPEGFGNLSGRVDSSLLQLHSLAFLDLRGNWFNGGPIPPWLGSLRQLEHLDLSDAGFAGAVPPQLGNLSSLQYLDVSSSPRSPPDLYLESFHWLSGLSSLRFLRMDGVDLSRFDAAEFIHFLNSNLASLVELCLPASGLSGIPHTLPTLINFTSLAVVDLSWNTFGSATIPSWLLNVTSLASLSMRSCGLQGAIPRGLSDLRNLQNLQLDSNNFSGKVPTSIGKLCNLRYLYLSSNNLTGELPQTLERSEDCSSGPLSNLVELDLSYNGISGSLPGWVGELKNIKSLSFESNMFSGPLPRSLGELSELVIFDASANHLAGAVSEAHLAGLRKLNELYVGGNPELAANISSDWTPPFQLVLLSMGACQLGPKFPTWIKNQKRLQQLDLSSAGISDTIPTWFWGVSSELRELNLSSNRITGGVPEIIAALKGLTSLDLSNNRLSGSIPSGLASMAMLSFLDLSNNNFSGEIPFRGGLKAFNMSSFRGNSFLCGPPTDVQYCTRDYSRGGRAGEEDGGCHGDTTAKVALFLMGMAGGVAILLLYLSVRKCCGSLRKQDAKANAAPPRPAAPQAGQLKQAL